MKKRQFLSASSLSVLQFLTPKAWAQKNELSSEMKILSEYMAQAMHNPLPPEVALQAKFHLLDSYAAIISGSELPPGQSGINFIKRHAGIGKCTIIGTKLKASPFDAALAIIALALILVAQLFQQLLQAPSSSTSLAIIYSKQ